MAADPEHWLSEIRGRRIVSPDGSCVGRVSDLVLGPAGTHPSVAEVLFQRRDGPLLRVPWSGLSPRGAAALELSPDAHVELGPEPATMPLLGRDVLDAQVVDLTGRRVRRVSDVRLREVAGDLEVVGIDTGWRTLLRRLRLWPGHSRPDAVLAWSAIHLAVPDEHAPALATHAGGLGRLSPADLCEVVARLRPEQGAALLEAAGPDHAADALGVARPRLCGRLVASLPEEAAGEILSAMPAEPAAAALRHVEPGRRAALLGRVPDEHAAALRRRLAPQPRSARA